MTVKNVSNLAASVQARLQNLARTTKRPFQELLQYYAMERFLYRLSRTPHRASFETVPSTSPSCSVSLRDATFMRLTLPCRPVSAVPMKACQIAACNADRYRQLVATSLARMGFSLEDRTLGAGALRLGVNLKGLEDALGVEARTVLTRTLLVTNFESLDRFSQDGCATEAIARGTKGRAGASEWVSFASGALLQKKLQTWSSGSETVSDPRWPLLGDRVPRALAGVAVSTTELEELTIANTEFILGNVRPLPCSLGDLATLEKLDEGTYRCDRPPQAAELRALTRFGNDEGEVGVFCVSGTWLLALSKTAHVGFREPELVALQNRGIFQLDLHTHPGDDEEARRPSDGDLLHLGNSIDKKLYIACVDGLIELQLSQELPAWSPQRLWEHWILEVLKLTEPEFNTRGAWALRDEFLERYFGRRLIPWDREAEIDELIARKTRLRTPEP